MSSIPIDLYPGQQRKFTGPDNKPWCAWRDREGRYNYSPEAPPDELQEHQVIITVQSIRTGHETWAWMVDASSALDSGDESLILPELDDVIAELDTADKAFALGLRGWAAYLEENRRCPFCGATFDIAFKDLDGHLPIHKHAASKADETDDDGNCVGSRQEVEELIYDGIYRRQTARQLLEAA